MTVQRVLAYASSATLGILAALVANLLFASKLVPPPSVPHARVNVPIASADQAIAHLQDFIRLQTVSSAEAALHVGQRESTFKEAVAYLRTTYASFFNAPDVSVELVSTYSLLVRWRGSQASLQPVMFYGHYDVVPIANETLPRWTHPPFSAANEDGFIWGRGTLDMKGPLVALLEAFAQLQGSGHKPVRTLLLGIGHDEEVGGGYGAHGIAQKLEASGTRLAMLHDEGTPVLSDGFAPLHGGPVALVGTAEKGMAGFKVIIKAAGGHSSMPQTDKTHTAMIVADIVRAIDANQPPAKLQEPLASMLRGLAPHAPFYMRGLLHFCDFRPLDWLMARLWSASGPAPNAQVRSTAVPTILHMGVAQNVIPQYAEMSVDMRLLQGDDDESALRHLQRAIDASGHSSSVTIERIERNLIGKEPSAVAAASGRWWDIVRRAAQETIEVRDFEGAVIGHQVTVIPSILTGRTDSANLRHLSDGGVFRFLPIAFNRTGGDLAGVHGIDERIRPQAFLNAIQYYTRALELFSSASDA